MTNCLDADQARHFVGPDLGSNCLQRLSADDISYHAALVRCFAGYHIPVSILKTEGKSFCRLLIFFAKLMFSKNYIWNTIRVSNCLDPCKFGSNSPTSSGDSFHTRKQNQYDSFVGES